MAENRRLPITVLREQLYEEVWATPLRTLARGYGISDVALGKICKKLNVPRPGPGYWAVVRHSEEAPDKPALPPLTLGTLPTFVIRGASHSSSPVNARVEAPKVEVSTKLERPHSTVRDIQRALGGPFDGEIFGLYSRGFTPFRVSRSSLDRALRILDAICRALEARGHVLELQAKTEPHETSRSLRATVSGKDIDIGIGERITQKDHVPTPTEMRREKARGYFNSPRYDYLPSGRLTLRLEAPWGTLSRRSWSDGERQRLEDVLGEVVLAIEATAERIHLKEAEHEQQRREELEAARQQAIAKARSDHENALAEDLSRMASCWHEAGRLRDFIAAVEQSKAFEQNEKGHAEWLSWARRHAESLDPLNRPEKIAKVLEPDLRKVEEAWEREHRSFFR